MKNDVLMCVRCAKPITETHRFRVTEEGILMHVDCLRPSEGAIEPSGKCNERGEFRGVLYPGKF